MGIGVATQDKDTLAMEDLCMQNQTNATKKEVLEIENKIEDQVRTKVTDPIETANAKVKATAIENIENEANKEIAEINAGKISADGALDNLAAKGSQEIASQEMHEIDNM